MKQEDQCYEKWLDALKATQPVLDNPDELTAAIMQRVSQTSQQEPSRTLPKSKKRLIIGSWASLAVAGVLLCLLMSETFFLSIPIPKKGEQPFTLNTVSSSFPDNWGEKTAIEKSRYLSAVYEQKRRQRVKRENMLEYIVRNQTKSTGYEKE